MCLAIPGRLVQITDREKRLATVEIGGVERRIDISLLDAADGSDHGGVGPGDWVLVHVGFAIAKVDADEAAATLRLLQGMGPDYEQALRELEESPAASPPDTWPFGGDPE